MIAGEYDNLRKGGEALVGKMREQGVGVEYRAFLFTLGVVLLLSDMMMGSSIVRNHHGRYDTRSVLSCRPLS